MSQTKTQLFRFLICGILFALPGAGLVRGASCSANTMPDWDGSISNKWFAAAQTFVVPSSSCNELMTYEFELAARSTPGTFQFQIYQWGASGPVGSPVYSTTLSWGTTATLFDLSNIDVTLDPTLIYGAEVNFGFYNGLGIYFQNNQTSYTGGNAWFNDGSWQSYPYNDYFAATFGPAAPEPATVLLLLVGAVPLAFVLWQRRART